jgi:hypothetical protein
MFMGRTIHMGKTQKTLPVCKAFWSLLWRSVVLVPFATLLFVLCIGMWSGVVALPLAAGYFLFEADWRNAAIAFAIWSGLLWFTRWKLWKLFQAAPKDRLNSQENV